MKTWSVLVLSNNFPIVCLERSYKMQKKLIKKEAHCLKLQ